MKVQVYKSPIVGGWFTIISNDAQPFFNIWIKAEQIDWLIEKLQKAKQVINEEISKEDGKSKT